MLLDNSGLLKTKVCQKKWHPYFNVKLMKQYLIAPHNWIVFSASEFYQGTLPIIAIIFGICRHVNNISARPRSSQNTYDYTILHVFRAMTPSPSRAGSAVHWPHLERAAGGRLAVLEALPLSTPHPAALQRIVSDQRHCQHHPGQRYYA